MQLLQLTAKQLQISFPYLLNLGATRFPQAVIQNFIFRTQHIPTFHFIALLLRTK